MATSRLLDWDFLLQPQPFLSWGGLRSCNHPVKVVSEHPMPLEDWKSIVFAIRDEIQGIFDKLPEINRINELQTEILSLKERLSRLEQCTPIIVPIDSLEPAPYIIRKPFHAVLRPCDNGFVASFYDANINASGETRGEAVLNLKDMIIAVYSTLKAHPKRCLGSEPKRQLSVLRSLIREKF